MPKKTELRQMRVFLGMVILAAASAFVSCSRETVSWTAQESAALHRWLDARPNGPSGPVTLELQAGRPVVFLHDSVWRRDSILMLQAMLPSIHDAGVRELGVFFLESDAQADIDELLSGGTDKEPGELIRMADARLGYREYCDFVRYVKDFNARISIDEERIRIIGLDRRGTLDPEVLGTLLPDQTEDADARPSFLWIRSEDHVILPGTDAVILTHHQPGSGILDMILQERVLRDRSFAFRADEDPFASWDHYRIPESSDIVVVTPFENTAVTPIEDFITEENLDIAREYFPETGSDSRPSFQAAAMNRAIARAARRYAASID